MRRFTLGAVVPLLLGGLVAQTPAAHAASADPVSVAAVVQGLNVAVSWHDGDTAGVTGYTVTTSPKSADSTVPPGATSAVLTGLQPGVPYTVSVAARTAEGSGAAVAAPGTVRTTPPGGSFTGLTPARLLDTRSGLGAPEGPTASVTLAVAGRGGVPATGVSAVALNVTVTAPTAAGFVTVYPAGKPLPNASNVNYVKGDTVSNAVVVPVGTGGAVQLAASNPAQLIADVSGYWTTTATAAPAAGRFHALAPSRLLDTRSGLGATTPKGGGTVDLQVTGQGPVPESGVSAVVLNTTVTGPTANGYVTVYPTGKPRPTASSVNFAPGATRANRVVVPVGAGGRVSFYNHAGTTQVVADITGWYTDGSDPSAGGSYFVAVAPHRLVDTRTGLGAPKAPLGTGGVLPVRVAGEDGLPPAGTDTPPTAAVLTVTTVAGASNTFLSAYPSLAAVPSTSDLNAPPHRAVPNLALPGLGVDGAVNVLNHAGDVAVVVDLSGYFIGDVHTPASTVTAPDGTISAVTNGPDGPEQVTVAPGATAPNVGQIIASGVTPSTPQGLLVQVTSVSTDDSGATVAAVRPAGLQEALGDSDIALSAPLGAGDVVNTVSGGGTSAAGGPAPATPEPIGPAQLRARATGQATPRAISTSGAQHCDGDTGSTASVSASFTPTLVFEAALGHSGFVPTVTAKAGVDVSEQTGLTVAFGGKVSCSWSATLATYTFRPVEFAVGGVPVVIVPVFTVTMTGKANGSAQLSASISQTLDAQAGIRYANGDVTPYHGVTHRTTRTGPAVSAARADASLSLTGDLEGKLYGIAGPEASVTGTLSLDADPADSPWWTLGFSLSAEAALHISVLFVHVDASARFPVLSAVLAEAAGGATGSPPVITTTRLPDGTTGHAYSTQLTTADHRTGSWALAGGSLPPGLTLSGYTVSGTPAATGTSAFTLRFTDTQGHTVQAPGALTVYAGSAAPTTGRVSGRITDTQGHPLAGVAVSALECGCAGAPVIASGTTGADGRYTLTGLPPATGYGVCFDPADATGGISDASGYVFRCFGQDLDGGGPPTGVAVTAGGTTAGISEVADAGGAISGRVDGPDGRPLGDGDAWAAALTGSVGLVPSRDPGDWTHSDGTYLIKGIPRGDVELCFMGSARAAYPDGTGFGASCYGGHPLSDPQWTTLVTPRETNRGFNGRIGRGAALSGRVTDSAGAPLAGVWVDVEGVSGSDPSAYAAEILTATTDSNGDYAVADLTPGTDFEVCFNGFAATGGGQAPRGYGTQCYNGVAQGSEHITLIRQTAGQFRTGVDGRLTKNPASAPATRPSVSATAPAPAPPAVIGRRSP
ncbi:fibronectin type III domain-containing protein [Streptomyces sp. IBSBF 2435]|uniref:fibronectin type III domain-containing protein n=1 Tax=Streptomyces sp. IBSBF 2435 TaxID=2903531 RepID=UPI002FDC5811